MIRGARLTLAAAMAIGVVACTAKPAPNSAYAAAATLSGPVTTGHVVEPLSGVPTNMAQFGYTEQEFFASGTATAFTAVSTPGDGRWSVQPATSAPYRTRILVRRPGPSRFNGTLVVEWMNVSAGESAPDWDYLNPELMRSGFAYVGVSTQALGVQGGAPILGGSAAVGAPGGLIKAEASRYGTLHHPGDQYALDIFAQIARALRGGGASALGGLRPRHVVAVGESQSAFYLTTFADALQNHVRAFDGIFIHSRGGAGAPLNGASIVGGSGTQGLRIRTDLDVPVMMFETQTDLIELGYAAARQPDTGRIRTWEVAGTSHADAYLVGAAAGLLGCTAPVNAGPQHPVVQAAFAALARWVTTGTAPPSPPPFELTSIRPAALALDAHGNVIGGVRTPAVDVPVSTLSGAPPKGATAICSLFGSTTPFSGGVLVRLYRTKQAYLARYQQSLDEAITGGYILPADRPGLLADAQRMQFPASP